MSPFLGEKDDALDNIYSSTEISIDSLDAKNAELLEWKTCGVYTEVEDKGQGSISLRWVLKPKMINGQQSLKARLCARGFEEEQGFRTDSPTCSREGVRLAITTIASHSWKLNSIDVRTAFLQGKEIERTVFVKPPKEANTSKIWRLNKCVYGLADASRYWYLKFREELVKLGAKPCPFDQGIFIWTKNGTLQGIAICFVDDVIWGGNDEFSETILKLKSIFHFGSEKQTLFGFLGVDFRQHSDYSITADQRNYIKSVNAIPLTASDKANPSRELSDSERKSLRCALGKLNWLAGMTRPEISFDTCEISTHIKDAKISDIIRVNKVIKFVKSTESYLRFPKLDLNSLSLKVFTDASWNNLPNGGSQGGQIVLLCDQMNLSSPICWNSSKLKRVARSTLAAESLSLPEGCDSAFFVAKLISFINNSSNIPISAYTDSDSLYKTAMTTNLTIDRRLRVEISAIREMCERKEIELIWIAKQRQLSDVLTKKGASPHLLMEVLQTGNVSMTQH